MKITKFVHSCLLVETPDRVAIFDPGGFATLDPAKLERLDDIFITHNHGDHLNVGLVKQLAAQFPNVRIFATAQGVEQLKAAGIQATNTPPEGAELFDSPHETTEPLFPTPQQHGIHYLGQLTDPGDSHHFRETKAILALPVQAPWGGTIAAAALALQLKPKYVIPIHDWHWSDQARAGMYDLLDGVFKEAGISFIKPVDGQSFDLEV